MNIAMPGKRMNTAVIFFFFKKRLKSFSTPIHGFQYDLVLNQDFRLF